MAKVKPEFSIDSYGIYDHWDENSKSLPKIRQFTTTIPAELDIEFGFTLKAKKAKGLKLNWFIYHPNVHGKDGTPLEPFTGDVYIRNNDWDFYLGDTLWLPLEDKTGVWHMAIEYNGKVIAEKKFTVTLDDLDKESERLFWKKRGF